MINFEVSAPGTLNFFGENVTCDDHNGVMTSINRRNILKFKELKNGPVIALEFSDIAMYRAMHIQQFRNFYEDCTFDDTLSEQILEFISSALSWDNECQKKIGHMFFYLLVQVIHRENIEIKNLKPFQVSLHTQLRNQNFGGFASLAVCFTTCFLHWSNLRRDDHHELNDNDRAKISMYSKSCDKIFTHCKFKSEVTVSTYGSMLRYHCKDSSQNDVLDNMPTMKILIINSTLDLFNIEEGMKAKANLINCDSRLDSSFNSIISDTAFSALKEINDMNKKAATYSQDVSTLEKKLFNLIRIQQELNKIFIKFNKEMNTVCEIAGRNQLSGKCADFIHGRNTYIWRTSDINTSSMENDFRSNGFDVNPIDLNCDGVRIYNIY